MCLQAAKLIANSAEHDQTPNVCQIYLPEYLG